MSGSTRRRTSAPGGTNASQSAVAMTSPKTPTRSPVRSYNETGAARSSMRSPPSATRAVCSMAEPLTKWSGRSSTRRASTRISPMNRSRTTPTQRSIGSGPRTDHLSRSRAPFSRVSHQVSITALKPNPRNRQQRSAHRTEQRSVRTRRLRFGFEGPNRQNPTNSRVFPHRPELSGEQSLLEPPSEGSVAVGGVGDNWSLGAHPC